MKIEDIKKHSKEEKENLSSPSEDCDLPFRLGVGMVIMNKKKQIFIGKRIDRKHYGWQMPQGGIDKGEGPKETVMREMLEEIGTNKGRIIAKTDAWYSYKIPKKSAAKLWGGKYCGQKQKWFLIEFQGEDDEININTKHPEFVKWKWAYVDEILEEVVSFKFTLYKSILDEFEKYFK